MNYLNYFDLVIFFILFIMSVIGFYNGFIREAVNLFVWILSITFSILILNLFLEFLKINDNILLTLSFFILLFFILFIFLHLTIFIVFPEIKMIESNYLDKVSGLILGFLKGLILLVFSTSIMIYLFYTIQDFPEIFEKSILFKLLKNYSIKIMEIVVELI